MLKRLIKKLPIINKIITIRHLKYQLERSNKQLHLAVGHIEQSNVKALVAKASAASELSERNIIVSLTSYGERVQAVHQTILSLLCQSVPADKIILWLADNEFTLEQLPPSLLVLTKYGLDIRFCSDIRSFKKLVPTLKAFPDSTIITFDDDVVYPENQIEKLINKHQQFPDAVVCHHAREMVKMSNGLLAPYNDWPFASESFSPKKSLFPVGIGGVLYPADVLHNDVLNEGVFMRLCPQADDLWFKVMALKNNHLAVQVDDPMPYEDYLLAPKSQERSLWQENRFNNDEQLANILAEYSSIKL